MSGVTPEQLHAARELCERPLWSSADIVALLAAREAAAYRRGWDACREKARQAVERARPHTMASENSDLYVAYEDGAKSVHSALEPPSGEGE